MMTLKEEVARAICVSRGADPDAPITIGLPSGEMRRHEIAWQGYTDLADELIAIVRRSRSKKGSG